jgi:predicted transcriptional regulator
LISKYNILMATEQRPRTNVDDRARLARAAAEAGFEDVLVIERDTAKRILTDRRRELLDRVREGGIESVRGLARALDRDKAAVSRDLDLLFEEYLIEYINDGNRKAPRLKHETILAEPLV